MESWNSSFSTLCDYDEKSEKDWYRQLSDHEDTINILRDYRVPCDFHRLKMVEYRALRKVTIRDLWKQGPHILDVLAITRNMLKRKDHGLNIEYKIAQLPYTEENFEWLTKQMTENHFAQYIPYILAVPVTSEVIEVIVNERVILPTNHVIPEVLPHGVICRQAAFQSKHRLAYKMGIPKPFRTTNKIIKDMAESLTLTPCPWSIVNNKITLADQSSWGSY